MNFEWKRIKNKSSFEDKVHNLACFEVVINILRMKTKANEDPSNEIEALCTFALEYMFLNDKLTDLSDKGTFDLIMTLKDKKVDKFISKLLKDMGVPTGISNSPEIGEA